MAWTASHVSRRWRRLSTTFPGLWSRICVAITPNLSAIDSGAAQLLKLHLHRSSQALLSIFLYKHTGNFREVILALELLRPSLARCVALHLQCREEDFFSFFASRAPPSFPHLQLLSIYPRYDSDKPSALRGFQHSPKLRHLRGDLCLFNNMSLPWSQITHFEGFASFLRDSAIFLPKLVNVTSFVMQSDNALYWAFHISSGGDTQYIELASLSVLSICATKSEEVVHLLILPALETLKMLQLSGAQPLHDMIRRSGCGRTLRCLHLGFEGSARHEEDCARFLEETPYLEELKIKLPQPHNFYDLIDWVFFPIEGFGTAQKSYPTLTCLKTLVLSIPYSKEEDEDDLRHLMKELRRRIPSLENLRIPGLPGL